MVVAAARYKKIVQVGTMNRSRATVLDAIKFVHEGGIGKVYMARGLCFKPRPPIGKYPDGPMAPGEKYALTVGSTSYEPTYDKPYLAKVDYDLWLGPRPSAPSIAIAFTTTGTGTGTTATVIRAIRVRTSSTLHAGASTSRSTRFASSRRADTSGPKRRRKRRTRTPRCSSTATAPSSNLRRAASSPTTKARNASAISSTARRAGYGSMAMAVSGSRTSVRRTRRGQAPNCQARRTRAIRWS